MTRNNRAQVSKRLPSATLGLLGCAALGFTSMSFAEDATCKLLFDALERSAIAPAHQYITMTMSVLNGGKPTSSETINTGTAMYMKNDGKWTKFPTAPEAMKASIEEKRKTSKSSCMFVQDETVEGVTASVYLVNEEGIASKIWLSKQTSLPIRVVTDIGTTMHSETRYVYGPVSAPTT